MKVIAYEILVAGEPDALTEKVVNMLALDCGWHPQGGVAATPDHLLVQAMVRFAEVRVMTPGRA